HPEIGAAPVNAPVVILGQPRTGTTILFDLLAQDPRFRAPLTWEVASPNPPPETATYGTDPRIAESAAAQAMSEVLNPGFQAIHPSGPQRAQEDVAIMGGSFRTMLYPTAFRLPTYMRWLIDECDMAPGFAYHRRFLQLLQWRHPGERWVLKTPAHQWCLGALFAEYPDATIVHTHRDPLKVIASAASLTEHLQRMASGATTLQETAAEWSEYLIDGNDQSVTARQDGTVPPSQAVDLPFRALMGDPFAALAQLYDGIGMPFTTEAEQAMRAFLAENPADKHGVHRYAFSATGLDCEALRLRTRRYEDYFGVEQESLG
ncbi:MAG: sulfotransferase family protein, partial [Ilumatobacteraceae bacterium]|nr:sulfotransferase family protein [Ilumatobacteraceae bacterium]